MENTITNSDVLTADKIYKALKLMKYLYRSGCVDFELYAEVVASFCPIESLDQFQDVKIHLQNLYGDNYAECLSRKQALSRRSLRQSIDRS